MNKFIILTLTDSGRTPIHVNVAYINTFRRESGDDYTALDLSASDFEVAESPEQIAELIRNAQ